METRRIATGRTLGGHQRERRSGRRSSVAFGSLVAAACVSLAAAGWNELRAGQAEATDRNPTESEQPDSRAPKANDATGSKRKRSTAERRRINDTVRAAFAATHDGWSADEVVLHDERGEAFLAKCRESLPDVAADELNWTLLNLRKAGELDVATTRRRRDVHDDYLHAAEIAARFVQDKHKTTIDRAMCHPEQRAEFDAAARAIAPDVEAYLLRKAAFGLRKARRLQPELVVRVADWGRDVVSVSAAELAKDPTRIPEKPGVYIFRDATGYLYIGESSDLRDRVGKHLDHSDRKSLAHYLWQNGAEKITVELHTFDPASRAKEKTVRRAYESELIRSRSPRLNIAP